MGLIQSLSASIIVKYILNPVFFILYIILKLKDIIITLLVYVCVFVHVCKVCQSDCHLIRAINDGGISVGAMCI